MLTETEAIGDLKGGFVRARHFGEGTDQLEQTVAAHLKLIFRMIQKDIYIS